MSAIDVIAITSGPGLIGSLLVGVNTAKTLAYANNKPIIGINHWLGHIYSCFPTIEQSNNITIPQFPLLALIVSGGHTGLVIMRSHTDYEQIGETLDDAAGEAFDKVSKMLGLGYPGGPAISKAAATIEQSNNLAISFPRAMLNSGDYNFSFSGIKTSVLNKVKELEKKVIDRDSSSNNKSPNHGLPNHYKSLVAHEFQQCVIDILIGKTLKAAEEYKPKSILLCGGVSANKNLREQMAGAIAQYNESCIKYHGEKTHNTSYKIHHTISFFVPPMPLTGDNAAMIGIAAAYQISAGVKPTTYDRVNVNSNLKL